MRAYLSLYWQVGIAAVIGLFLCNIFFGSVSIPAAAVMDILFGRDAERTAWTAIILQSRLPQALTALLAGAALAVSGLLLQTLFRNPLAGPDILGVSNGANLGVAIVMLYAGAWAPTGFSVVAAALAGAMTVLGVILYFSSKLKSNILLLIIGMMTGYLASSVISLLNALAASDSIRSYVLWGLGSFSSVSMAQMPVFAGVVVAGLIAALMLVKPLNILLLGEYYASGLGVNIKRLRLVILLIVGLLTAMVTACCGPVSFIGLAVPHIARLLIGTANQQRLLPATLLMGAIVALLCNALTTAFGRNIVPLNAITPLLGAPVIIYIIARKRINRTLAH